MLQHSLADQKKNNEYGGQARNIPERQHVLGLPCWCNRLAFTLEFGSVFVKPEQPHQQGAVDGDCNIIDQKPDIAENTIIDRRTKNAGGKVKADR